MVSYSNNNKFSETFFARTKLWKNFETAAKKRTVYVSAPAGFGKTVSTRHWLENAGYNIFWLSLDEHDNAPANFFSLLCKCLLSLQPSNQAMTAILHDASFSSSPLEHTYQLLNHFTPENKPYALVLDNGHQITDKKIRQDFLVVQKRLPQSFTTFILTREEIDLFELEYAGGHSNCEVITAQQLAFSTEEIQTYFLSQKCPLSKKEASNIKKITNGWPFGVSALAAAGTSTLNYKNTHFFNDYFNKQFWQKLSTELQYFLLCTAIVDKITPELATKLTDREDSQEVLDTLCVHYFFITCYDHQCYRYHQLFVDFLQRKLVESSPERVEELYRKAANYYLDQQEIFLARGYALKSGDKATIMRTNATTRKTDQDYSTISVEEFLNVFCGYMNNQLFKEKIFPYPYLYSQYAGYYFLKGDVIMAEYCFDKIEENLTVIQQDYPQFLADSLLIIFIDSRKSLVQIIKKFLKYRVLPKFEERLKWSTVTMQLPFLHRSSRDFCELGQFSLLKMPTSLIRQTLGSRSTIMLLLVQAGILYEKYQFKKARVLVQNADRLRQQEPCDNETVFCCLMLLAAIYSSQQSKEHLVSIMDNIETYVQNQNQTFKENYQAFKTNLALLNGQQPVAKIWLTNHSPEKSDSLELYRIYQHFTTARALLVTNQTNKAKDFLAKLRKLAEGFHRPTDKAEVEILQAILEWHLNHSRKALHTLETALIEMQKYDYARVLAAEGAAVLPILYKLQTVIKESEHTSVVDPVFLAKTIKLAEEQAVVHRGVAQYIRMPAVKLSKQQRKMLKLLAEGYKNAEIAKMTNVTVHTVKFHLSAAYRKLGVTNAKDAVKIAKQKGFF